ncbi:MAG TPA: nuclear transport factor 2 family protein [Steroidobacteraceae bacterium]|nr:nuclear transport factor 2 family protein [Steroidobacteraceae bacterium]
MATCLLFAQPVLAATTALQMQARLDHLEIEVTRAEDLRAIKKLQRAYGYYADRGLWDELADLFAADAIANYPSGGFDGNASIRAMFVQNLGQGKPGLSEGRIYNHTILQPVIDLAPDGLTATGRWRVLGMLGRFGGSATWADSLYRFDYVKQNGQWKIKLLTAYAGSGGSYEQGWVLPKPRPPGAADTSPIRFNLAHPADRPWIDPCESDVSVCVVPFPYPNRGGMRPPTQVSAAINALDLAADARAADLLRRARRLEDEQAVMNLQHAYGYYLDRGLWRQLADLFAPDGSREVGQGGVYVGRERVFQSMQLTGPPGLRAGQLNDHLEFEPIVEISADGLSATGRIFELAFVGGGGQSAQLIQNVQQNDYVRRGGMWMIKAAHHYSILLTDYDRGWGKSALPAPAPSAELPPDRPPSVVYEAYPKVYTPPLHFADASAQSSVPAAPSPARVSGSRIAIAERQVRRAMDYHEIENLQNAYGYYAEKSLWSEMAQLFTARGVLQIDDRQYAGQERILDFLKGAGPEGPVKGALNSQLQLQPVIHVSADGRAAKIRSRLLQLSRDAQGRPQLGSGIYENEFQKEDGIWKFSRLHLYRTWQVLYQGGWAAASQTEGQLLPSRFTPPFHYRKP